ncbi:MAG TPA: T9SS type A sorting domain-containing protein, partial [Flavobacteriales bacterium]|nr:T9SS type A sorting domain-containing protein [Flavobacteriales bacterium]
PGNAHVFPNPSTGDLIVQCGQPMQRLSLFDATGKLVQQHALAGTTSAALLVEQAGVYQLLIETKDGRSTQRVLIQ